MTVGLHERTTRSNASDFPLGWGIYGAFETTLTERLSIKGFASPTLGYSILVGFSCMDKFTEVLYLSADRFHCIWPRERQISSRTDYSREEPPYFPTQLEVKHIECLERAEHDDIFTDIAFCSTLIIFLSRGIYPNKC